MSPQVRTRRWLAALAAVTTVAGVALAAQVAFADTPFSATFEDGSTSGWSKSGGTWSVVTDGSKVLQQSNTGSENARDFAGDSNWTSYTVQAAVKPLSLGSSGFVGLLARSTGATTAYRLALLSGNQVQLQAVNSGSVTVLGSASRTVSAGTWYTLAITVNGSAISASVDGAQVAAASNTSIAKGRIGLQTAYSSANFDNITVTTGGTTPTPTATTASPQPSTSQSPPTSPSPSTSQPPSSSLFVAPNGSAGNPGTQASPTTLASAITRVTAGGTISVRGGTYNLSSTVTIAVGNNGTSGAPKRIVAYPGETPVLSFAAQSEDPANRGLAVNGNYWYIGGIVVERAGDNGIFIGGSNNTIERVVTRFNRDSGLQISRAASDTPKAQWPSNNLVISSESHDNADSDGEDADGFAAKLTSGTGNVFRYTVSHNNIDDGWDLYTKTDTGAIGPVTIQDSLSYSNGTLSNGTVNTNGDRNGYKLGGEDIGVNHVVQRSIAYRNGKHGFTYNSNPGAMTISSNLSVDNAERNFSFDAGTHTYRGNTSCRFAVSGSNDKTIGNADSSNQFWTGTNGSRCTTYSGALAWSFASDGRLVVTLGGRTVSL
ncbi:family 16 glycoside hydrolase [Dactylosporangium sp. NPDC005555]|uniref:family 16 glycoside hydrolase n=1 Tax=Dactylosporangium sp. NPDC005555 TaxID=3154889 RepID=UPI0033BB6E10